MARNKLDPASLLFALCFGWATLFTGCAFTPSHPCQSAGEPARDEPFKGDRRCSQKRGPDGKYVNDGLYQEWFPDGKIALVGAYKMGKKDGYWTEYNVYGNVVADRYFEDGVEVVAKRRK